MQGSNFSRQSTCKFASNTRLSETLLTTSILAGVRIVDILMISMIIRSESSGAALSKSGKATHRPPPPKKGYDYPYNTS